MSVKSSGTHEPRRRFARTGRQLFQHRLTGARELRERVRPVRAAPFSAPTQRGARTASACSPLTGGEFSAEPQRGVALCGARETAAPAAGAKRKDNLRFSFLFELLPFPYFLVWRRLPTCDRCEMGERQSGYLSVSFSAFSQFTDSVLLHMWVNQRRRDITVSRNSLARCNAQHLRG